MKRLCTFLLLTIATANLSSQDFNLELVSRVDIDDFANDIWGYVDEDGTEYAIIGAHNSTKVYSLEDPSAPQLKTSISGANSTWRDIKTFQNFVYVVADVGADGVLVINMTDPENITSEKLNLEIPGGVVQRCHNLYIDTEIGVMFLAGCNTLNGVLAFDLNADPANPTYVNAITSRYSHDVFVQDNLVYSSEINNGQLAIYNIEDIMSPETLGIAKTTNFFTHNAWADEENEYVYTTDEVSNGTIDAYDISDLSNPIRIDAFVPASVQDQGTVPHNAHFMNDYLITSWYSYGVVVTDVSNPSKITEVAHFETSAESPADCWGAYPYLPSGLVLASDISNGLFVLRPSYERAAYLGGKITDAESGNPIFGAQVMIMSSSPNLDESDPQGDYLSGQLEEGTFTVLYDHPEYDGFETEVTISKGQTTIVDVQLNKSPTFNQIFNTVLASSGQSVADVDIKILNEENEYDVNSAANGSVSEVIIAGDYQVIAGKWGFEYAAVDLTLDAAGNYTIELEPGYADDFLFENDWTTETPNTRSEWVRVIPSGTTFQGQQSNPGEDLPGDFGSHCFVTGNGSGGAGQNDVDDGTSILKSPLMELAAFPNARLSFHPWFFNDGGSGSVPNDSFKIFVFNGANKVLLTNIHENTNGWGEEIEFNLVDFIELNDEVQIIFEAADDIGDGHLVEAAIDQFRVKLELASSTDEIPALNTAIKLSPNPVVDILSIKASESLKNVQFNIYTINGQRIQHNEAGQIFEGEAYEIETSLIPGFYILEVIAEDQYVSSTKFVKI